MKENETTKASDILFSSLINILTTTRLQTGLLLTLRSYKLGTFVMTAGLPGDA